MTELVANTTPALSPKHPGELLDDIIPKTGRSKSEIACLLGISRQHFHAILAGRKPVSPEVAAKLGKLFGDGTAVWLRMQATFDAWHAEREVDTSSIPTIRAA